MLDIQFNIDQIIQKYGPTVWSAAERQVQVTIILDLVWAAIGKPVGWGIAVEGYEDDGWLFHLPEKEQAALVIKAHNQEYDDAEEALYGDGHLAHLQWAGTASS